MPKYFCDYCDTYLTHDSPSVRKTHCAGRKHRENVKFYYEKWYEQNMQKIQRPPMIPPPSSFPTLDFPPPPLPGVINTALPPPPLPSLANVMLPPPGMIPPPPHQLNVMPPNVMIPPPTSSLLGPPPSHMTSMLPPPGMPTLLAPPPSMPPQTQGSNHPGYNTTDLH